MSDSKETKWLLEKKYKGQKTDGFYADIERLKSGEPVDYVIGFSDFLNCKIYLDNCPLIPRTETEYWVHETLPELRKKTAEQERAILDIFAGSGCIGVSLLKHVPNISVTFAEKDVALLSTIEKNLKENAVESLPHTVVQSDIFSAITKKFDYIYANPPYIDKEKGTAEKSVVEFEPHEALFAKDAGLYFIKKLIVEAPKHLTSGGIVFIEFDSWQKDEIANFLKSTTSLYDHSEFLVDQHARARVLRLVACS